MERPVVTLKQLQCLLAVNETAHFRRAAEACGISQPSLSAQIQNLEAALAVRLVERSRSGVALTPIGREVVERARRIAEETQGIIDLTKSAKGGLLGTIRVGTSHTLGPYLMPYVVAELHQRYKELNLYIREGPPRDLEFDLGRGLHDVVIGQLPSVSTEHVATRLFREPLYLAVAIDHPLATKEKVTVDDLRGLGVLSLNPHYHYHDQVASLCETFGARLLHDYEGTSLDALRQMVGMGMGAAFLPALYCESEIRPRSEVVVKSISGRSISRSIGLVWRKSAGRADSYKAIADTVRQVAARRFKDLLIEDAN